MPRRRREDQRGELHHVFNRGLARRPVFESRHEVRLFLALLVREVREGRLEIEAFVVMTTHFHLLVRSVRGELSRVLQRVMSRYVRAFNRRRGRDGPLFRSRFCSRPVRSTTYRRALWRYIDRNPTRAGMAAEPWAFDHGSAARYASGRPPRWLRSAWAEAILAQAPGRTAAQRYAAAFGATVLPAEVRLVEARMRRPATAEDDLDALVEGTPTDVRDWLRSRRRLADGPRAPTYASSRSVAGVVEAGARTDPEWLHGVAGRKEASAWGVLRVALLRDVAGLAHAEIARHTASTATTVRRRLERHRRLLDDCPPYAERAAALTSSAIQRTLGRAASSRTHAA